MCWLNQNFLTFAVLFASSAAAVKLCNTTNLIKLECRENEMCVSDQYNIGVGHCLCQNGFELVNGTECLKKIDLSEPASSSLVHDTKDSNLAAAIIIPLLLLSLIIFGVFIGYRYRVVAWIRNKINQRQGNYDEVMIGQDMDDDDPPLR